MQIVKEQGKRVTGVHEENLVQQRCKLIPYTAWPSIRSKNKLVDFHCL